MKKNKKQPKITQPVFTGKNLAMSDALIADRWVALTVLDADKSYTLEQAKQIINDFKNKGVN